MKCFYHNDADGKCAGFWVHYRTRLAPHTETLDFIEMSYEKPFPMDTILPDEQIYIVDYSITPNEMRELLKITQDVTWIDHHKTAIERYKDFGHDIRGIRYDGIAGCMLTYCYLTHMTNGGRGEVHPFDLKMTEDAPLFTKLIADWDVWKFEFGDTTRCFVTAFNCGNFDPQSPEWLKFNRTESREVCPETYMVIKGANMLEYRDGWAKGYLERFGFETEFEGLKCFALNLSNCSSEYFKSLPDGKYDAFIAFAFNGKEWIISMYSTSADVSVICKKYGGGGHKGAAVCMSEHAKVPSGIYGLIPLPDEPKPKKKQESNLEDCLDCEFLGLDELWSEFYCKKADTRIHEDDDLVNEEKCKYFRRKTI